jgi:tetratricopeptide (TPR) repeat protein
MDVSAADAEIISVIGKGDKRDTAQTDWIPAFIKQTVKAGGFVRTRDLSQMAILLPDRTQLRLNQNSQMQIKTVAEAAEWSQSTVKLNAGRAWSQARQPTAPPGTVAPPARLSMETPSATLSIRGTDWEVEVGPDGRTQLVVLSGEVDIVNDQGSLKVGAGEAAAAEIGKAPVRLILANPAERVQWVTAWQVQPRRWVPLSSPELAPIIALMEAGDYAAAALQLKLTRASAERDVLNADLAMMSGDIAQAIALLEPHAAAGNGNPRASALLARAHLARGDEASALLATARGAHPNDVELWLATADLALFRGDVRMARESLAKSLEIDSHNADAWFARGSLETERENIRAGRAALEAALAARPDFSRAQAERGTLETLAGNFESARGFYEQALAAAPDNYIALTGRGILKLKSGDSHGALEDFLRAGVIEPRFGRAWLYSAAAFYQLGEPQRARQALDKARQLDPLDPLPHVMLGLIAADQLDLGRAVDAARDAQERMPYLKSLNQILNNQKGSANVGSALAAFGLDEWARHYATSAYSPWWAGSHLFLADRYSPGYNKNSELFKGFMTDPTVFGASQRESSLVPAPGHHGRADLFMEQGDWRQNALIGTANGLVIEPVPLAYFVSADLSDGHSRVTADASGGTNLTLGLGMRPHHALGVFMFGTDTRIRGDLNNPTLPDDPLSIDDSRLDLGISVKLDASNQLWLKQGTGRQSVLVRGRVMITSLVPPLKPLDRFLSGVRQNDTQFRHAFAPADGLWLSWGYEDARQDKQAYFDARLPASLAISELGELQSRDAHVVARIPLADHLRGELGVFSQRTRSILRAETRVNGALSGTATNNRRAFDEINWRAGVQWQFGPRSTLTAVNQKWRRPASVGSLAPVDTLGIAVNDRLTTNGGLYRRNRIQLDHEAGAATFLQGFVDREAIENISSPLTAVVPDLQMTELESLRNRRDVFTVQPELEEAPQFLEGRVRTYGLALNQRTSRDHTLALSYRRAEAQQTGLRNGARIPYLPRTYLRVGSHWSLPQRWLLGAHATWRGDRYRGEANTAAQRIDAGWVFGATAYWESADKRWVAQAILENLRRNRNSSDDRASKLILRASYLF